MKKLKLKQIKTGIYKTIFILNFMLIFVIAGRMESGMDDLVTGIIFIVINYIIMAISGVKGGLLTFKTK